MLSNHIDIIEESNRSHYQREITDDGRIIQKEYIIIGKRTKRYNQIEDSSFKTYIKYTMKYNFVGAHCLINSKIGIQSQIIQRYYFFADTLDELTQLIIDKEPKIVRYLRTEPYREGLEPEIELTNQEAKNKYAKEHFNNKSLLKLIEYTRIQLATKLVKE